MILGGVEGLFVRTSSLEVGGEDVFIRTGLLEVVVEVSLQKSAECSLSYKLVVVSLSSGQIPATRQMKIKKEAICSQSEFTGFLANPV